MIPCIRECPDRSPTCHGKCEKYQDFVKDREKERNYRIVKNMIDMHSDGNSKSPIWHTHRKGG